MFKKCSELTTSLRHCYLRLLLELNMPKPNFFLLGPEKVFLHLDQNFKFLYPFIAAQTKSTNAMLCLPKIFSKCYIAFIMRLCIDVASANCWQLFLIFNWLVQCLVDINNNWSELLIQGVLKIYRRLLSLLLKCDNIFYYHCSVVGHLRLLLLLALSVYVSL